jgi:Tol biopolymer transport system component
MDQKPHRWVSIFSTILLAGVLHSPVAAQSGEPIHPAYEGYVINPDGTYTLMFGYFSHNSDTVSIPQGPDNTFLSPTLGDRGQPTIFFPGPNRFVCRMVFDGDAVGTPQWTLAWAGQRNTTTESVLLPYYTLENRDEANPSRAGLNTQTVPRGVCVNTPPSIDLSLSDEVVDLDLAEEVVLVVTVSDDGLPRGGRVTAAWSQTTGPGRVTFQDTGHVRTVASFSEPGDYDLRLSVTDSDVTVTRDVSIAAISPDAIAPRSEPKLSPDGRRVVLRGAGRLWQQPLEGGPAERLLEGNSVEVDPAISPDGRYVAFMRILDREKQICLVDLEGGSPTVCYGGLSLDSSPPVFSPDGSRVAFVTAGETEVWVLEVDSGRARSLARNQSNFDPWLNWSADGRRLILQDHGGSRPQTHRIVAVDVMDGTMTTIIADGLGPTAQGVIDADGPLRADGQLLYIVAPDAGGTSSLFSLSLDGRAEPELVMAMADFVVERVSADGRWLSLTRAGRRGIWLAPLDRGRIEPSDVRLLNPDGETGFAFTPDGAALVYVADDRIWLQPLEDGDREEIPIQVER